MNTTSLTAFLWLFLLPLTVFAALKGDPSITPVDPVCANAAPFFLEAADPGGVWSGSGIVDPATGLFDPAEAGDATVTVTYELCGLTDEAVIVLVPVPDAGFSYDATTFCEGEPNPLPEVAEEGGVFSISAGGAIDPSTGEVLLEGIPAGEYMVSYTVEGECTASSSVVISYVEADGDLAPQDPVCEDDALVELDSGGISGSWSGPGIIDPDAGIFSPDAAGGAGDYTFTLTTSGECAFDLATSIEVFDDPFLFVEPEQSISLGDSIQLEVAGDAGEVSWSPSEGLSCTTCANPWASPESTTSYLISLVNPGGCISTAVVVVEVTDDFELFLPTMFSPNGDGENDTYRALGTPLDNYTMLIFNRWGQVVFETNDYENAWDGNFGGRALPPGAFVVQVTGTSAAGDQVVETVNLTLVR